MDTENDRGSRFICGLSLNEDERVRDFREVFQNSATSGWARDVIVQVYRLAGSGAWDVSSIYDVQMLMTAIEENPRLMPVIENDVDSLVQRLERLGCSFRITWNCVRERLSRSNAATAGSCGEGRAA